MRRVKPAGCPTHAYMDPPGGRESAIAATTARPQTPPRRRGNSSQGGAAMYVDPGLAILRLVVGGIVLAHGVQKLGYLGGGGPSGTVGVMAHIGVKPEPFWAAVVT